ncbi:MAG: hypothetical protein WA029_10685 [Anaerolineae bacterium]
MVNVQPANFTSAHRRAAAPQPVPEHIVGTSSPRLSSSNGDPSVTGKSSMNSEASTSNSNNQHQITLERPLRTLTPHQVTMVDLVLADLGEFGQMHLIVRNSRVLLRLVGKTN